MLDQTIRLVIKIPSGEVDIKEVDKIPSFWDLVKTDAINDNVLRRFKFARIQGKFYNGKSRGALLVGDSKESQIEYVDSTEDYVINGANDLKRLVVVSTTPNPIEAVVILQF